MKNKEIIELIFAFVALKVVLLLYSNNLLGRVL